MLHLFILENYKILCKISSKNETSQKQFLHPEVIVDILDYNSNIVFYIF